MSTAKSAKRRDHKPESPVAEVLPIEKVTPATMYTTALAKSDAVLASTGGACRGLIPMQRAYHGSTWQNLLKEDQSTRD
jgi:hypothetical protein